MCQRKQACRKSSHKINQVEKQQMGTRERSREQKDEIASQGTCFANSTLNLHWSFCLLDVLTHFFQRGRHRSPSNSSLFSDAFRLPTHHCQFHIWKAEWTDTLTPLSHCSFPIHIVSKICPTSSLPVVVLTKQRKEVVYCYVYFPSLRCRFLTTMLSLFWESSASKTWSNLLHPEAIEQTRVMAAITYSTSKNM